MGAQPSLPQEVCAAGQDGVAQQPQFRRIRHVSLQESVKHIQKQLRGAACDDVRLLVADLPQLRLHRRVARRAAGRLRWPCAAETCSR